MTVGTHIEWNAGSTAPAGVWLVAGTPATEPYPCRCRSWGVCSPKFCPCSGRTDYINITTSCCAWSTNTPEVAARAQRS